MKNKFGYRDRTENAITQDEPLKVAVNLSNLTDDELRIMKDITAKVQQ